MKLKERLTIAKAAISENMRQKKITASTAYEIKAKGIRARFNRLMAMHRTKFNMLAGFSSFVVAGFYVDTIVGFIVLGVSLFLTEWLSGG